MALEEGLDTGGVYARTRGAHRRRRPPPPSCGPTWSTAGTALLVDTLDRPLDTWIDDPEPQVGEITYASKFDIGRLRDRLVAPLPIEVHRLIRVGGAWTTFRGKRLKINEARLVDGRVVPAVVQPEGKPAMAFDAWRNGARPAPDELFGDL